MRDELCVAASVVVAMTAPPISSQDLLTLTLGSCAYAALPSPVVGLTVDNDGCGGTNCSIVS
ncbi:Uncharacterised protein [Mycobacteroides abscessus subsp. abscessus]|nr:Uncharacterised protein [Mycobacteroides abscessus subsp. abscessus]